MEENQQVLSIGRPSNAISQSWIDVEHGEMILLGDKKKVKFNLHQSIQLMDEENNYCMLIESSLLPFKSKHLRSFKKTLLKDMN